MYILNVQWKIWKIHNCTWSLFKDLIYKLTTKINSIKLPLKDILRIKVDLSSPLAAFGAVN